MAKYRSEAYYRIYRGRLRPPSHYLLGALPRWVGLATRLPGLAKVINAAMATPLRKIAFKVAGLDTRRQAPRLVTERFSKWAKRVGIEQALAGARPQDRYVALWADSFSETLDSVGAKATVKVLHEAGYKVLLAPPSCCGLTWISTGQLPAAKKRGDPDRRGGTVLQCRPPRRSSRTTAPGQAGAPGGEERLHIGRTA